MMILGVGCEMGQADVFIQVRKRRALKTARLLAFTHDMRERTLERTRLHKQIGRQHEVGDTSTTLHGELDMLNSIPTISADTPAQRAHVGNSRQRRDATVTVRANLVTHKVGM